MSMMRLVMNTMMLGPNLHRYLDLKTCLDPDSNPNMCYNLYARYFSFFSICNYKSCANVTILVNSSLRICIFVSLKIQV